MALCSKFVFVIFIVKGCDFMLRYIPISNLNFQDINPLDCGEEICYPTFARGPINFNYYIMHFVFSGSGIFNIDGEEYLTEKGQISIIHPENINHYYTDPNNPWHYSWIGFQTNLDLPIVKNNHLVTLPQAERIFNELINSDKIEHGREFYICGKIFELLTLIEQLGSNNLNATNSYVTKAKNFIDINYSNAISFEKLAADLGLSRNYLGSIFKNYEHITLYQYLTHVRLEKAIGLMITHKFSVGSAAISVGYPDIYTFSKAFKRKYNCSPLSYINNQG